jgi:hypothetical protein
MHTQFADEVKNHIKLITYIPLYDSMNLHYYPIKKMTGFTWFYQIPSWYLPSFHSARYDLVVLLLNRHNLGVVYPPMVPWFQAHLQQAALLKKVAESMKDL